MEHRQPPTLRGAGEGRTGPRIGPSCVRPATEEGDDAVRERADLPPGSDVRRTPAEATRRGAILPLPPSRVPAQSDLLGDERGASGDERATVRDLAQRVGRGDGSDGAPPSRRGGAPTVPPLGPSGSGRPGGGRASPSLASRKPLNSPEPPPTQPCPRRPKRRGAPSWSGSGSSRSGSA